MRRVGDLENPGIGCKCLYMGVYLEPELGGKDREESEGCWSAVHDESCLLMSRDVNSAD